MDKEKEEKISKTEKETQETSKTRGSFSVQRQSADATEQTTGSTIVDSDVRAATFLDVATLRCLFVPQWQEEGVHWALQFFYYRLVISYKLKSTLLCQKLTHDILIVLIQNINI